MAEKPKLSIEAAREILRRAWRHVLEDRAFGDKEVGWCRRDDETQVATGYLGRHSHVCLTETSEYAATSFEGDVAEELCRLGTCAGYEFNDDGE
ncbi:MAG: hypothetical protein PHH01_04220 [Patescibacteria group bacterium]|nr:hypothetical protein [Patescibacteria group bacterium]